MESIKLYQIESGKLIDITKTPADANVKENDEVHDWICKNPTVIENGLKIIGRRVRCGTKEIDVLGIDNEKRIVIIEAKRGQAARDVIGQVIDYASRLSEWDSAQYLDTYKEYISHIVNPGSSFELSEDYFNDISLTLRILVVCFSVDPDVKRMAEWLSEYCSLNISLSVFSFGENNGNKFLAAMVVQENVRPSRPARKYDEELRQLLYAIDQRISDSNAEFERFPVKRGTIYQRTVYCYSSSLGADILFDSRIPVLRFYEEVVAPDGIKSEIVDGKLQIRFEQFLSTTNSEVAADILNALKSCRST